MICLFFYKIIICFTAALEDGDEPYSPGGSDEDTNVFLTSQPNVSNQHSNTPAETSANVLDQDDIQRKMDELTRQIEAQKMEIAGMLQTDAVHLDEPYSPTSLLGTATTSTKKSSIPTLAEISIPSNLQEILNSINKVSTHDLTSIDTGTTTHIVSDSDDEEYTPTTATGISYKSAAADYIPSKTLLSSSGSSAGVSHLFSHTQDSKQQKQDSFSGKSAEPSKLAQLTDEELLSMVPDDVRMDSIPLPKRSIDMDEKSAAAKKSKYQLYDPPPPGLEDEYVP